MLRRMLSYVTLPLLLLLSNSSGNSAPQNPDSQTGTLEKMIVANGNVAMDLDLNRLNGTAAGTQESKRKLYNVPHRMAFAFWFWAKVSELQLREPVVCTGVHGVLL